MNENNNFQIKFANAAGMLASRFSINPTVGQLYGLLYMSPEPVSLNEMVEKLGISKGAVSTNIRILESWGAVKKVWVDNSRKDYYEANPDTLNIIIDRLKNGLSRRLEETKESVSRIDEEMKADKIPEVNGFYKERISNIKEMYGQAKQLMNLLLGE